MMQRRISWQFGPAVGEIVAANSDTDQIPKPPWAERKQAYLESMPQKSAPALRVSLADKLHNARSIVADLRQHGPALWSRFTGTAERTGGYYVALAQAFEREAVRLGPAALPAIEDLRGLAAEIERFVQDDTEEAPKSTAGWAACQFPRAAGDLPLEGHVADREHEQ